MPYPKSWPGFTNGAKIQPYGLKQALQVVALYCGWQAASLKNLQRQKQNRKRKKNKYHKRPSEKFQTAFLYLCKTVPTLCPKVCLLKRVCCGGKLCCRAGFDAEYVRLLIRTSLLPRILPATVFAHCRSGSAIRPLLRFFWHRAVWCCVAAGGRNGRRCGFVRRGFCR